ncbi:MAG: 4'-phosphopantetheinyl transferase superfamily protein [Chloroflexota bacterium]|nr:4'-phosphopantetheinyl transferase superfamily protein [Chloroflexota bacterium]
MWQTPPASFELGDDEIHVWRAALDGSEERAWDLERTLAADERERAARFRFPEHRMHYIVARGILRAILGGYLGREPETLQFCYNEYGKPALVSEGDETNEIGTERGGPGARETGRRPAAPLHENLGDALCFNVSHAHGLALYAFAWGRDVGVDVEYVRMEVDFLEIAEHFFSPYEVALLRAVPPAEQYRAFFNCWTRKEAYIKARGMGLSLALDQFDVSLTPGEPAALLNIREAGQDSRDWSLHVLSPSEGYVAALAVKGRPTHILQWQWP